MLTGGPALAASELGKAAPLGLLVVLLLCIAVFLLGRSMVTHLKKVPDSFDEQPTGPQNPPGTGPGHDADAAPRQDGSGPAPDGPN